MIDELADAVRNMVRRVRLTAVDDTGKQQTTKLAGLKGESFEDVVRVQHFGFSSNPPEGSEGVIVSLGGRSDRALALGVEHPDTRPTGGQGGSSVQYDANGNSVRLDGNGVTITGASKITLVVGGCSLVITSAGFTFTGGTITHNGKNIGSSHTHTGVTPGGSNTGTPT